MMHPFRKIIFATILTSALSAHAATEITYWLWDTNQLPAYKACYIVLGIVGAVVGGFLFAQLCCGYV